MTSIEWLIEKIGIIDIKDPYYKELFRLHQLEPHSIQCFDDLQKIPLLEKKSILKDPLIFVNGRYSTDNLIRIHRKY